MSIRAATRQRIEQAHRFSAFYRGHFASHLPMALVALDAMGADDARVAGYAGDYEASHLEPLQPAAFAIGRGDEAAWLGQSEAFAAWVDHFARRIREEGWQPVLHAFVDRFADGLASAAFHGAIRTAYALEAGSDAELAHALAYWASAYEPIAPCAVGAGSLSPVAAMRAMRERTVEPVRLPGRSIASRIRVAASDSRFTGWCSQVDARSLSMDAIADTLIRMYGATGDFTILHGVTGCHAARSLVAYASDATQFVRHLWRAVVAMHAAEGMPLPDGWVLSGSPDLGWPDIHERAVLCVDEHDVKLAYSCWREWQHRGEDLYRRVASARVCAAQPVRERQPVAC